MKLSSLLEKLSYSVLQGSVDTEITDIINDSRKAVPGSLFFCIKGAVSDGHAYAKDVAAKGAAALIVQEPVDVPESVTVIRVEDTRIAMALISCAWYGYPAEKMHVIGITGTKGKTTTTYMIKSILEAAGFRGGLIGTIETIIGDTCTPAGNTTPESYPDPGIFPENGGCRLQIVVMEVSSQALMMDRVAGIVFDFGIFTNIEPDHIGPTEHKSFEDYLECKSRLFRQCRTGILNADDKHLEQILKGHTCEVETFGFSERQGFRPRTRILLPVPVIWA